MWQLRTFEKPAYNLMKWSPASRISTNFFPWMIIKRCEFSTSLEQDGSMVWPLPINHNRNELWKCLIYWNLSKEVANAANVVTNYKLNSSAKDCTNFLSGEGCRRYKKKKLQQIITIKPALQFVIHWLYLIYFHYVSLPPCQVALHFML